MTWVGIWCVLEAMKWRILMCAAHIIRLNQLAFHWNGYSMGQCLLDSLIVGVSLSCRFLSGSCKQRRGIVSWFLVSVLLQGISMEIKMTSWYVIILLHFTGEGGKGKGLGEHGKSMLAACKCREKNPHEKANMLLSTNTFPFIHPSITRVHSEELHFHSVSLHLRINSLHRCW